MELILMKSVLCNMHWDDFLLWNYSQYPWFFEIVYFLFLRHTPDYRELKLIERNKTEVQEYKTFISFYLPFCKGEEERKAKEKKKKK